MQNRNSIAVCYCMMCRAAVQGTTKISLIHLLWGLFRFGYVTEPANTKSMSYTHNSHPNGIRMVGWREAGSDQTSNQRGRVWDMKISAATRSACEVPFFPLAKLHPNYAHLLQKCDKCTTWFSATITAPSSDVGNKRTDAFNYIVLFIKYAFR